MENAKNVFFCQKWEKNQSGSKLTEMVRKLFEIIIVGFFEPHPKKGGPIKFGPKMKNENCSKMIFGNFWQHLGWSGLCDQKSQGLINVFGNFP